MIPLFVLWNTVRVYAPYIILPVAAVIGAVGYNAEYWVRGGDLSTPYRESIQEERDERVLAETLEKDPTEVTSLKQKKDIPRTIFGSNERKQ